MASPLKLLLREQPQGVAHDDSGAAAALSVLHLPSQHVEGGGTQVRLRLATASREPDQIHDVTAGIVLVPDAAQYQ